MDSLLLTLALAFAVVIIAIALLAISWLITGKSKIVPGACGRSPDKKKEGCGTETSCYLCKKPPDLNLHKEEKNDNDSL